MAEAREPIAPAELQCPSGWSVTSVNANGEGCYKSRTGKRLRSIYEVHHHLKEELGERSCTKDELLWLRTLERYGSTCKHWAAARSGVDIPEAPTFYPTAEEFQDPGRYVLKLLPTISKWGICKVVPPKDWSPKPWSGVPPTGAADSPVVTGTADCYSDEAVEKACTALSGGVSAPNGGGSNEAGGAAGSRVEVSPRVQLLSLFNTSFEMFAGTLSLSQYRELAEVVWPACAAGSKHAGEARVAEAEEQFWDVLAGSMSKDFAMYATKLRMEARAYQEFVQAQQGPYPEDEAAPGQPRVKQEEQDGRPASRPVTTATPLPASIGACNAAPEASGGASASLDDPTAPAGDAPMGTAAPLPAASAAVVPLHPAPPPVARAPSGPAPNPRGWSARVLPEIPWELQGAPPVLARPAGARPRSWAGEHASSADGGGNGGSEKRRWTKAEDDRMRHLREQGRSWAYIGTAMDRTLMAVKARWFGKLVDRSLDGTAGDGGEEGGGAAGGARAAGSSGEWEGLQDEAESDDGEPEEPEATIDRLDSVSGSRSPVGTDSAGQVQCAFGEGLPPPSGQSGEEPQPPPPSAPPSPPHEADATAAAADPAAVAGVPHSAGPTATCTVAAAVVSAPAAVVLPIVHGAGGLTALDGGLKGKWVRVNGLKSNSHLNGKVGKAQDWDAASRRYHVQLKGERKMLAMKVDHLQEAERPSPREAPTGKQPAAADPRIASDAAGCCAHAPAAAAPLLQCPAAAMALTERSLVANGSGDQKPTACCLACAGKHCRHTCDKLVKPGTKRRPSSAGAARPISGGGEGGCGSDGGGSDGETGGHAGTAGGSAEAEAGAAKRRRRPKEQTKKEKPICATPGCTLKRFHFGPCSSEVTAAAEGEDCDRGSRPSRRAGKDKDYRLLADEIDERDYGWAPEPGRRSLGTWAAEDERATRRADVMAAATRGPAAAPAQPVILGAHAPYSRTGSCSQGEAHYQAGVTAAVAAGGATTAAAAAKAAKEAGVQGDYSVLSKGEAMQRALSALNIQSLGSPCSLYASDIPYGGVEPACDVSRGELTPTSTRSGVMDSLLRTSLLRFSPPIPGVNYPMVYIGTRNTFFCWHVEDNLLYATNYVVAGAPKVWYGVPLHAMEAMEAAWRSAFPSLFARHPDLQYWKTSIFSPAVLHAAGVPVFRLVAEPGTFVFTEPGAYHCGFNTGFNVAESTNFAFPDWLPVGEKALARYRTPPTRDSTLLHDALLCVAAHHGRAEEARGIAPHLRAVLDREARARDKLAASGVVVPPEPSEPPPTAPGGGAAGGTDGARECVGAGGGGESRPWPNDWDHAAAERDGWRCRVCRHLCYFSVVRCSCAADFHLCPEHGMHMPEADTSRPRGYIHFDEDDSLDSTWRQQSHPLEMARRFSGLRADVNVGVAAGGGTGTVEGLADAMGPPSAPPSPPSESTKPHQASPLSAVLPPPHHAHHLTASPPSAIPQSGPVPPATAAPVVGAAPAAVLAAKFVKFKCSHCSMRLKVRAPQVTRCINTPCFSCKLLHQMTVTPDGKVLSGPTAAPRSAPTASPPIVMPQARPAAAPATAQPAMPPAAEPAGQPAVHQLPGPMYRPEMPPLAQPGPHVGLAPSSCQSPLAQAAGPAQLEARGRCMGGGRSIGGGAPLVFGANYGMPRQPCTCVPSQRRLVVRHPLRQIEQLICTATDRAQPD